MGKWVIETLSSMGYLGIALLMFVENVFPPIPSELIMPLAGYIARHGELALLGISLAGMLGSLLGALPLYYLGRRIGEERLKELADRHGWWLTVSSRDVERSRRWFDRHGAAAVLFGRLVPGVRSIISIPAGVARMKLPVFLLFTTLGSGLWAASLAYIGYLLGTHFDKVGDFIDPISWLVLAAVALLYFKRLLRCRRRQPA